MFVLAEIKDTVRILPPKFDQDLHDCISNELNKKLANKVVFNVGLCVALHDITEIGASYILPGDGASHTAVSLEFFDDIIIPYEYLQQPSKFDEEEQLWVWEYETDEGTHDLFMDIGEEIRFRVIDETFTDMTPVGPEMTTQDVAEKENKKSPYVISATITEPGLGLLSWWTNS